MAILVLQIHFGILTAYSKREFFKVAPDRIYATSKNWSIGMVLDGSGRKQDGSPTPAIEF
jgi:hypothetical protein